MNLGNIPICESDPSPESPSLPIVRPEFAFLIIAFVAGLFMATVNPPFQSPDEDAHFTRVFQLSEGTLIAQKNQGQVGGWLPQSIFDAYQPFPNIKKVDLAIVHKLLREPFAKEPRHFFEFKHTALYSPVAYGPAVAGVWVGRLIGLSALGQLYASRMATLLVWLLIVFIAIRVIPVFKWVMVMIALMPMTVFLSASPSADVMTNALAMLTTALILRSALARKGSVEPGEWMTIVATCMLLALTKQVYFLMAVLTFMTPVERFGSWKKKTMLCLGAIGAATVANLIWLILVRNIVVVEEWAHPHEQLMFVLSYPLKYAVMLWQMLSNRWDNYLLWFVGTLGWLNVWLPPWIWPTYLTVLIAVALIDKGDGRPLKWGDRVLIIGMSVATVVLIATSLYISYTGLRAKMIRGIQGRYFIPLAVASLLVFYNRKVNASEKVFGMKVNVSEKVFGIIVILFCTMVLAVTGQTLIDRYYP
jgi:uncharacterized membrane protein